jgi:hypothetical protein
MVPQAVNKLLSGCRKKDAGIFPSRGGYQVIITANGKSNHICWVKDKTEARLRYMEAKFNFIQQVVKKYEQYLDIRVLKNLKSKRRLNKFLLGSEL